MMKRRTMIGLLVLLLAVVWVAVEFGGDGTVKVEITQTMIDCALAKKFPKEKTYLKIVRVSYANPKVTFLTDQEKVLVSMDVVVNVGVKGLEKSYAGSAALATRIGYNPANYQFSLQEAEFQDLVIPKIAQDKMDLVRDGLNAIAREFVDEVPVYKLTKHDTRTELAKLLLKAVVIKKDRVVVTLGVK